MRPTHVTLRLVRTALLALLLTGVLRSESESQAPATSQDEALAINLEDVNWGPPGTRDRFPRGVRTAQLGIDPDTGGPSYYAKFPTGSHFDLHWHSHTEYVAVVQGEVTIVLGDKTHALATGSYVVIPGGMNHSWDVPAGGDDAVILVRRRGPADFHFVEP